MDISTLKTNAICTIKTTIAMLKSIEQFGLKGIDDNTERSSLTALSVVYERSGNKRRDKDISGIPSLLRQTVYLAKRISNIGILCVSDEEYDFKKNASKQITSTVIQFDEYLSDEDKLKIIKKLQNSMK